MPELLSFLENWYASQCDGDWEHQFGVRIDTLDNPGWHLHVDLLGTEHEGVTSSPTKVERSEHDWVHTSSDGQMFEAAMGPRNLTEGLAAFRAFVEKADASD